MKKEDKKAPERKPSCIHCKNRMICKIKEKSDELFTAAATAIHDTASLYRGLYEGIAEKCDRWDAEPYSNK